MMRGTLGTAVWRWLMAALLAGALNISAGGGPLEAGAVGGINTVTVSPTHGKAAASFAVTYTFSPCQGVAGLTIGFSWNALPPAGQPLGTAATDSNCRATFSTSPPLNPATHAPPAPGSYQVYGYVALLTGAPTTDTEVSTSYIVDVTPTPSPASTPSAKASSHPSVSASSAASASASTVGSPATSASASSGSTQSGQPAAPAAGRHPSARPGWWTPGWVVVGGVIVLALVLAAASALLAGWIMRRRRARAGAVRDSRAA